MAYNPTKTRVWRDGTTPSTGTLALGSLFNAEFDQLYENWNNFFNAAGTQFSISQVNVDNIQSVDGDGVNFAEYFGYNIDAPVAQLHINEGSSGAALAHFTNTTTGATIGNGLSIGIDASENAVIYNRENTDLILYTNNTPIAYVKSTGMAIGADWLKGASGVVHIANGTNADTNWYASAQLVIESSGNGFINIRTPDNLNGGLLFSDPDATWSGRVSYEHSANIMQFFTATSERMRLNATGLYIGGPANPSNLLHIQGTTTPQMRIAYDSNSYWTASVADGGDLTLAAGEATGRLYITPGVSDRIVEFTNGTNIYCRDSGGTKVGSLQHDGTNFNIGTAGASPGNIVISNTTESTSKDTGALIVEGGVGVEKHITAGLGRYIAGSLHGTNYTEDQIFDAMSPYLPNVNDELIITGGLYGSITDNILVFSRAVRTSSTRITLYWTALTDGAGAGGIGTSGIDDGSATVYTGGLSVAW